MTEFHGDDRSLKVALWRAIGGLGIDQRCGVYEDLTSAISVGFIAWLDLDLAVSLRHDVLVVLAAGVLNHLRVRLEYEGIMNVRGRT